MDRQPNFGGALVITFGCLSHKVTVHFDRENEFFYDQMIITLFGQQLIEGLRATMC